MASHLHLGLRPPLNNLNNVDNVDNVDNDNLEDNLEDNLDMPTYEQARQEGLNQRQDDLARHSRERILLIVVILFLLLVNLGLILVNLGLILSLYHC
jgi:hypothetical protein